MPVPMTLLTVFSSSAGGGWTEKHVKMSSGDTPNLRTQLDSYISNVLPTRAELMGIGVKIVGVRISYPRAGAVASFGLRMNIPSPLVNQPGAGSSESLAINFIDATATKSKVLHMRGFWDNCVLDETYSPANPLAAGWTERLVAWKQALLAGGYGWLSKDPANSREADVVNYVSSDENIVTFALSAPGIDSVPVGSIVPIAFSRINDSTSVLNKTLMCQVLTPTSLVAVKPIAAGAFVSQGKASYRATAFVAYADTGSIVAGRRQMGKVSGRLAGRAKAKPTT